MRVRIVPLFVILGTLAAAAVSTSGLRFYDDDPLAREPESRDASAAGPSDIKLFYEYAYNLFAVSHYVPSNIRSQNINTIDEVPDSSWFTNRIGTVEVTPERIVRGPNRRPPPPEKWVSLREKRRHQPRLHRENANGDLVSQLRLAGESGRRLIGGGHRQKIFWALGYNQIEIFITTFDRRGWRSIRRQRRAAVGERTPLNRDDVNAILERAAGTPTARIESAGRLLKGKVLGPFRYEGTRPDDPNDVVTHQHRRELRALRVFGAWTNLVDLKAGNTLDTLVEADGRSTVKHYLQDVGSTFGMANNPHEWDMGWEYFSQNAATRRRILTFGFALSPWQTVPYTEYSSVGFFEGDEFDPTTWRPQTPTKPYLELRADDAFWAARRVAAFSDELIRAATRSGKLSDPAAEQHLVATVIKRRDKVLAAYLPAINPVVNPRLDAGGSLTFENAAVAASVAKAPAEYRVAWSRFDNNTGETQAIGDTRSAMTTHKAPRDLPPAAGSFVQIDISADSADHPTWQQPVRVHFRRTDSGWKLVGLQRLP